MNRGLVREYIVRMNGGDADSVRELYHDDAQVLDGGTWIEIDAAVEAWRAAIDGLGVDMDIEAIIDDDDVVAVRYTERGWSRAAVGAGPASRRSYEIDAVDWFTVRDGRIDRHWRVRDRAAIARQLGWDMLVPSGPDREHAA